MEWKSGEGGTRNNASHWQNITPDAQILMSKIGLSSVISLSAEDRDRAGRPWLLSVCSGLGMSTNVEDSIDRITIMHSSISPGLLKWPKADVANTELQSMLCACETPTSVQLGVSYSLSEYKDILAIFIAFNKQVFLKLFFSM